MTVTPTLAGYKAISKFYNALMTGLVLTLVTRKSADAAAQFVEGHFRRQHLEKFLPGLKKLGLDGLPDAVACAQYHYFSNALGGVKTEYFAESDAKAWVRYPPPRWIWQGAAICGIPSHVNAGMLHGWHGHNGVSLGNKRLGFVCTGQTVDGSSGLEGYYLDYGHEISKSERVRFAFDEPTPDYDPATAPKLDLADWPEERLKKIERAYAMEYVRSLVPTMLAQVSGHTKQNCIWVTLPVLSACNFMMRQPLCLAPIPAAHVILRTIWQVWLPRKAKWWRLQRAAGWSQFARPGGV